jgi:hypothetical protein
MLLDVPPSIILDDIEHSDRVVESVCTISIGS